MNSIRTGAATVVLVLAVAACSSATDGKGESSVIPSAGGSSSQSISGPSQTGSAPSSAPASGSSAPTSGGIAAALLPPSDIGAGYTATAQTAQESVLPCTPNDPPLRQQVPPADYAGRVFVRADQKLQVSQNVSSFADVADAQKTYDLAGRGFGCGSGTIGSDSVKISPPGKVTSSSATVDAGQGWDLAASSFKGTALILRIGPKILALSFVVEPGADQQGLSIQKIVDAAAAKLQAAN